MKAYGVATHRHTPEIEEQLGYASGKEGCYQLYTASGSDEQRNPWQQSTRSYKGCYLGRSKKQFTINIMQMKICPRSGEKMFTRKQNG